MGELDVGATAGGPREPGDAEYLLCIAGERAWRCALPPSGELVIGRAPDCGLVLADDRVSRQHAQLLIVPDGLRVTDLESRHGTTVNGHALRAPRLVASGDVIAIGGAILIVHRAARAARSAPIRDAGELAARLDEELERTLRYQRELAVAVLRAPELDRARLTAALAGRLRLIDLAAPLGDDELAIVLPEVDADEALAIVRDLVAGAARGLAAAIAVSPADGIDGARLLAAARESAEAAAPGAVVLAAATPRTLVLGGRAIVLADPEMIRLYELARRLARTGLPVLIRGETGAGKEVAAEAVHAFSERAGPLVSINCAAIPEALAESELFGHERGAFSGAHATKLGLLEAASGGTIFLDEVGDLPLPVQAKLLRALEHSEVTRVGDTRARPIDVRVVAATNRDLEGDIAAGTFRRDLFYRLAAGQLFLPPLRDRPRDLALLVGRVLEETCAAQGRAPLRASTGAMQALLLHRWPGNVRELRHALAVAVAAAPASATELEPWHLPASVTAAARTAAETPAPITHSAAAIRVTAPPPGEPAPPRDGAFRPIADEVRELERRRMIEALRASDGVQNQAAARIEMPLRTFVTKLKRYAIRADEWR